LRGHKIPVVVLAPVIREFWEGDDFEELARRAGVSGSIVARVVEERVETVMFGTADKILSRGLRRFDLWWHEPLEEHYWQGQVPPDKTRPNRCENARCEEGWFSSDEKIAPGYCSDTCRHQAFTDTQGFHAVETKICPECDKEFLGWGAKVFCTQLCRSRSWEKRRKDRRAVAA
jgi:hypothetical protein